MRVGICLDLRNPPGWRKNWSTLYGETLELCQEAEHLGVDSIWLSEHHLFDDGYLPQPLTFAAAIAARTTRVRIGTAILLAPLRSAATIAEEAAIVDLVSAGRLELGLGSGYRVPEYELFGADLRRKFGTTDSRARELREIWAAGRITPPPAQDRVPIWMGYHGPQGAQRAGRLGEGLLSLDPALLQPYRAGLVEGGHDVADARVSGVLSGFVTEDPERDWPVVGKHLAYQWDTYRNYGVEGTDHATPRPVDPDKWRRRGFSAGPTHFVYGPPDAVADEVGGALRDSPVDHVILWASLGAMPYEMTQRHVRTICTELAPRLKSRQAAPAIPAARA